MRRRHHTGGFGKQNAGGDGHEIKNFNKIFDDSDNFIAICNYSFNKRRTYCSNT